MRMSESAGEAPRKDAHEARGDRLIKAMKEVVRFREAALLLVIVILFVGMSARSSAFLTYDNIITTLAGVALNAIIGVGMTFALVSGGFDLSVGSVFAASGMVVGYLLVQGFGIVPAFLLAVLFGAAWGVVNGLLITRAGLNPLIVTLGTMGMARGFAFIVSEGQVIGGLPEGFNNIGQSSITLFHRAIPSFVLIALAIALVGDALLRRWVVLRQIYLIGGNEEAARLSGIRVDRVKFTVYVVIALLAGFAGVLGASRFASGSPTAGTGAELTVIAAVVIGGASLSGGEGTVLGTMLGLLLLGFVNDALILENVSVYWQQLIAGAILVVAVTADRLVSRKRLRGDA